MGNNALINIQMITYKCLEEFLNSLQVAKGMNSEWSKEFGQKGHKIGDTLQVRRPQRWLVKSGASYQQQPIVDTFSTVKVDRHRHIGFDYGAFEQVLDLDDIYNRYFKTSIRQLANQVDDEAAQFMYLNTNNTQGILGTNPASLADSQDLFLGALATLQENGCPGEDLTAVLGPRQATSVMKYLNTNYNPQVQIGRQYLSGALASAFGYERITIDQNLYSHTCGAWAGSPVVASSAADGDTSISVSGFTPATTVNPGDVFTVGDANTQKTMNVNPKNRRSTGQLKSFVVGGSVQLVADNSGLMTIPIGGDLGQQGFHNSSSQYANMDVLPTAAAVLTPFPATTSPGGKSGIQGLAFARDAFAFAPITLPKPGNCEYSAQATDPETGISLTLLTQFNAESYRWISRADIGFGFGVFYADNEAVRLMGQ